MKKVVSLLFLPYVLIAMELDIEQGKMQEHRHSDGGVTISAKEQEKLSLWDKVHALFPNVARTDDEGDYELTRVQNCVCHAIFGASSHNTQHGHIRSFKKAIASLKDSPYENEQKTYEILRALSSQDEQGSNNSNGFESQDEIREVVTDLVNKSLLTHFKQQERQVRNGKIWGGLTIGFALFMAIPTILQIIVSIPVGVACQ